MAARRQPAGSRDPRLEPCPLTSEGCRSRAQIGTAADGIGRLKVAGNGSQIDGSSRARLPTGIRLPAGSVVFTLYSRIIHALFTHSNIFLILRSETATAAGNGKIDGSSRDRARFGRLKVAGRRQPDRLVAAVSGRLKVADPRLPVAAVSGQFSAVSVPVCRLPDLPDQRLEPCPAAGCRFRLVAAVSVPVPVDPRFRLPFVSGQFSAVSVPVCRLPETNEPAGSILQIRPARCRARLPFPAAV